MVQKNVPSRERSGAQGGGGGVWRRQKEQNSIKGETRAIGTYVFCQISALVPIEVNCEICIYFTDLSEAAYT